MAVSAVILFFFLHMVIAFLMVGIGSVYHININQYAGLTREDINSVPSLTIAAGILMILFILGSYIIRNMYNKEAYIMMCLLLLMIQVAAGIHGCIKVADKNGFLKTTLQQDMTEDISQFYANNDTRYICYLIHVQNQLKCCGVNGPSDYNITQLPESCCPDNNESKNDMYCINTRERFQEGCAPIVYDNLFHNIGIVAYVAIALSLIQLVGTLYITVQLLGMDYQLAQGSTNYFNI